MFIIKLYTKKKKKYIVFCKKLKKTCIVCYINIALYDLEIKKFERTYQKMIRKIELSDLEEVFKLLDELYENKIEHFL